MKYYVHYDADADPREVRRDVSRRKLDSTVAGLWGLFRFVAVVLVLGGLVELLGLA